MRYWVIVIGLYLIGCSSDVPKNEFTHNTDIDSNSSMFDSKKEIENNSQNKRIIDIDSMFLNCYSEIVIAIGMHNDSLFNSFIHKDYGFYIIESSGAMPMVRNFHDIRDFKTINENKSINQLLYHEMEEPIYEALPKVICDEEIYDKHGCFIQEINPLLESQIWNYAGLNKEEVQAVEDLANTVKITLINTLKYTFFFSEIDGKCYLTFIDIRIPCTA